MEYGCGEDRGVCRDLISVPRVQPGPDCQTPYSSTLLVSWYEPDSPTVDFWVRARDQWTSNPCQHLNVEYFLDA